MVFQKIRICSHRDNCRYLRLMSSGFALTSRSRVSYGLCGNQTRSSAGNREDKLKPECFQYPLNLHLTLECGGLTREQLFHVAVSLRQRRGCGTARLSRRGRWPRAGSLGRWWHCGTDECSSKSLAVAAVQRCVTCSFLPRASRGHPGLDVTHVLCGFILPFVRFCGQ